MRKRFSCRRSISSMMRLYSVGSTMFPTERAVTCQLLATADSMMAWRIANPGGTEGRELHHTTVFLDFRAHKKENVLRIPNSLCAEKKQKQGYCGFQQWFVTIYCHTECKLLTDNALLTCLNNTNHLVGTACREENKRERKKREVSKQRGALQSKSWAVLGRQSNSLLILKYEQLLEWMARRRSRGEGGCLICLFLCQSKFWQMLNTFRVKVVRKAKIWAEIREKK